MRKYVFIGIGGIVGAVLRYMIKGININGYHGNIPLNTLIINVTGALILSVVLTFAAEIWNFNFDIRLGIAVGFLGAYTTFSTLCKEIAGLINVGRFSAALVYMVLSIVLGMVAVYAGYVLVKGISYLILPTIKKGIFESAAAKEDK